MATAQRKSHRHRSELKHLFISRAPPLNQTEPDPGHWPPDRDYNVVRVRTAGPSHTLLGVLLTTPFIQPYRLELTQTATSVTTHNTENVLICTVQMKLHVVQLPTVRNETEQVLHKLLFFSSNAENEWRLRANLLSWIKQRTVHAIKMRGSYAAFMCTLSFVGWN